MPLTIEDKEIIEFEARSWIGTPYHHRGRVKGVGVDCGQLIWACFEPVLGPFGAMPKYDVDWAIHNEDPIFLDFIKPFVREVQEAEWCDLILYKIGRSFAHAALVMKNGKLVHAWGTKHEGSVQENSALFFARNEHVRAHKIFRVA